MRFMFEV